MASEIMMGLGAFKTMFDIAKGLKDASDATIRNAAVIELQEQILAAQAAQMTLIERVGHLEEQMAAVKKWDTDKERYKLKQIIPGTTAYVLKNSEANGQPVHALCANCYHNGKKSVLQSNGECSIAKHALVCPSCKSAIKTNGAEITEYAD
jgi:DNA polymerase IIIc chi subunit